MSGTQTPVEDIPTVSTRGSPQTSHDGIRPLDSVQPSREPVVLYY